MCFSCAKESVCKRVFCYQDAAIRGFLSQKYFPILRMCLLYRTVNTEELRGLVDCRTSLNSWCEETRLRASVQFSLQCWWFIFWNHVYNSAVRTLLGSGWTGTVLINLPAPSGMPLWNPSASLTCTQRTAPRCVALPDQLQLREQFKRIIPGSRKHMSVLRHLLCPPARLNLVFLKVFLAPLL